MSNFLRFTTPITALAVTHARVKEARRINDTTKTLVLEVEFRADSIQIPLPLPPPIPQPEPEPGEPEPEPLPEPVQEYLEHWPDIDAVEMTISNEGCTRVRVQPFPRRVADLLLLDVVQVPPMQGHGAFEMALGSYYQGGNTALLHTLQALGLLPAGVAS